MKKLFFLLALSVSFVGFNVSAASPTTIQEAQNYGNRYEIRDYYVGKVSSTGEFTVSLPYGFSYVGCSANAKYIGGSSDSLRFKVDILDGPGLNMIIAQISTRNSSGNMVCFTIYGDVD